MPINGVNSIGHAEKASSPEGDGRYSTLLEGLAWTAGLAAALFTAKAVYTGVAETNTANATNVRVEAERQTRLNTAPEKDEQLKSLMADAQRTMDGILASSDESSDNPFDRIQEYALPGAFITPEIAAAVRTHVQEERDVILDEIERAYYETLNDPNARRANSMIIRLVLQDHIRPIASSSQPQKRNDLQASLRMN